jgi:hypothetical protein
LSSMTLTRVHVHLGVELGLVSEVISRAAGELGVELGLVAVVRARAAGELGVELGLVAVVRARAAGELGVELGLVAVVRARAAGELGVELGLVGSPVVRTAGALGVKAGLASKAYGGIVTVCCSPHATPNVLNWSVSGGGTGTTSYNASLGGWSVNDPVSAFLATLQCGGSGPAGTWSFHATAVHCTATTSGLTVVCNPFSLSAHVVISGGSCIGAGTFDVTLTAP